MNRALVVIFGSASWLNNRVAVSGIDGVFVALSSRHRGWDHDGLLGWFCDASNSAHDIKGVLDSLIMLDFHPGFFEVLYDREQIVCDFK